MQGRRAVLAGCPGWSSSGQVTLRWTEAGVWISVNLQGASVVNQQLLVALATHLRLQTKGTVERFNRTLLEEWAYRRLYRSNAAGDRALQPWVHRYSHHRAHTALGGRPPISRVTNLPGYYT
jgi:Integrase core domain